MMFLATTIHNFKSLIIILICEGPTNSNLSKFKIYYTFNNSLQKTIIVDIGVPGFKRHFHGKQGAVFHHNPLNRLALKV